MRKLYSENQIRKLASESGKKLYRHRIRISGFSSANEAVLFSTDVYDHESAAYDDTSVKGAGWTIGYLSGMGYANDTKSPIIQAKGDLSGFTFITANGTEHAVTYANGSYVVTDTVIEL